MNFEQGWRWVYIISGIPGLVAGAIVIMSIREPKNELLKDSDSETESNKKPLEATREFKFIVIKMKNFQKKFFLFLFAYLKRV